MPMPMPMFHAPGARTPGARMPDGRTPGARTPHPQPTPLVAGLAGADPLRRA
ncbi:hypothetical protein SAMN05428945_2190 [Streptomyces sp. 2224.1]|nr:hypothetical protein SAMN05428945_2190 [Streptomyces sp. 2224.1]SEE84342.1 hypothetical protein SAMN05428954_4121 [Streptomyces sp. 2112.3]